MDFNEDRPWRIATWFPDIKPETLERLRRYHSELLRFNQKLNLISANTERQMDLIHFSDCIFACQKIAKEKPGAILHDIGSGNGFPGVIAAILDPSRTVAMVERDLKKSEFLKFMVQLLGLKNATVMVQSAEDLEPASVQFAVSRGYASVPKAILALRKPFAVGGEYYHMKSESWLNEVSSIPPQLCSFWSPKLHFEYELPENGPSLCLILTKKTAV